jgi:hypothetical protein
LRGTSSARSTSAATCSPARISIGGGDLVPLGKRDGVIAKVGAQ